MNLEPVGLWRVSEVPVVGKVANLACGGASVADILDGLAGGGSLDGLVRNQ